MGHNTQLKLGGGSVTMERELLGTWLSVRWDALIFQHDICEIAVFAYQRLEEPITVGHTGD